MGNAGDWQLALSLQSTPFTQESGRHSLPDDPNWAVTAFADAELGDVRRPTRLVERAGVLAPHPTAARPAACGTGARLTAASRCFQHAAIAPQAMLDSHLAATDRRLAQGPVVLAVPETTAADWTAPPATKPLGPLGHPACQGRLVQSTLAFTPERVPVGRLAQRGWGRAPDEVGTRARRTQRPIRQQDSQQWLTRLEAGCPAQDGCPTTRFVSVGDRDADGYDLLVAERPTGVERLLRAAWDRCVRAPQRDVGATSAAPPVRAHRLWQGPRRGAQPGREATGALWYGPLPLSPPRQRTAERWPEGSLWAVQVADIAPPAAGEPLEGRLLTPMSVPTVAEAIERVAWYAWRWGIAGWHRMVNSGCRIAARQLATGERLPRRVTLSSGMAWRVFSAIRRARAVPERSCDVLVAIAAWQARYGASHACPIPPDTPPSLGEAVRWIAQRGGFVGRRRRDQPGAETWWRGVQHLTDLTKRYRIMRSAPP